MNKEDRFYIIGVDGGASKTRGILFTDQGETIASIIDTKIEKAINQPNFLLVSLSSSD